jgi:methionyl-tRNA formyltransferase
MKEPRIIFMGTPDFAVASLKALIDAKKNVVAVITSPDKPAGRGQQVQQSAVKKYAVENDLLVLQPEKLKNEEFLKQLKDLKADLQIVVAFRMLPEVVYAMPPMGTFNLHASLLPQYRGAAPINWAIINGESETGVTTFFLDKEIDTGKIIFRETTNISEEDNVGTLHDRLMEIGASLVVKTVDAIRDGTVELKSQDEFYSDESELKHAPKIFRETCRIDWNMENDQVFNFIRGLSPYPAAFTELVGPDENRIQLKVFSTKKSDHSGTPGTLVLQNNRSLHVHCGKGSLELADVQLAGKKRMPAADFLRGFSINESWHLA